MKKARGPPGSCAMGRESTGSIVLARLHAIVGDRASWKAPCRDEGRLPRRRRAKSLGRSR